MATRPSGVAAIDVWQHSHTRLSICTSGPNVPFGRMVVYISAISPSSSLAMLRPSSHMAPSFPSEVGTNETNPCCRFLPSRWGETGLLQVAPASLENTRLTSYASDVGPPVATNQLAARVPSGITAMDGTSAALTNQFAPRAIVFGTDQPCGPRAEKRRTYPFGVSGSSQLMTTRPSAPTARLGARLSGAAGDFSSVMVGAGAAVATTAAMASNMMYFRMATEFSDQSRTEQEVK